MGLQEENKNIPQVGLPKIFPINSSWVWINGSVPQGGSVHDCVEAELCCSVLEEVEEDIGVGHGEGVWFSSFRLLCDQFPMKFSRPLTSNPSTLCRTGRSRRRSSSSWC